VDITRVSLDRISRPASSSRAYCRSLNASLELSAPEPRFPKVDSPVSLAGSHQRGSLEGCCPEENKSDDREKSDGKEVRTDRQTTEENTTFLQKCILNPRCMSNSDSGEDSMETQTWKLSEPSQEKLSNATTANSSNVECSEETDVDPQIQAAIKEMNKLDTIL
ncbi:hypothetical protein N326_03989, partial [Eurypyga helias]